MGFAKFLSPRRIKLARSTARDFKLESAVADTAKFSFTLEGLCFAGNLDLKRDGLLSADTRGRRAGGDI